MILKYFVLILRTKETSTPDGVLAALEGLFLDLRL